MGLSLLSGFYKYYVPIIYITHIHMIYNYIYIIYQLIIAYIFMYHTHIYIYLHITHAYIYIYIAPTKLWLFTDPTLREASSSGSVGCEEERSSFERLDPNCGCRLAEISGTSRFFWWLHQKIKKQQIELKQLWWTCFLTPPAHFKTMPLTWEICRACRVELRLSYPEPDFHVVGC